MNLFLKFFLPNPDKGAFRRVFQKNIPTGNDSSHLLCYVTLESDVVSSDLAHVANFVWTEIVDTYGAYQGSALQAVKKSLRQALQKAQEVLKNNKEIVDRGVDFEVTICAVSKGNLYIAYLGNHYVTVFRENETHPITDLLVEHKVNAGSIALYPNDVVMVSDEKPDFDWSDPHKLLAQMSQAEAEDNLANGVVLFSNSIDFEQFLGDLPQLDEKEQNSISPDEELIDEEEYEVATNLTDEDYKAENSKEDLRPTSIDEPDEFGFAEDDAEPNMDMMATDDVDEVEVVQTAETVEPDQEIAQPTTFLDKLKKLGGAILLWFKTTAPKVQKVFKGIGNGFSKLVDFIANLIAKIKMLILGFLEKKYGKELWYKRMAAKFSQHDMSRSGGLGRIEVGSYRKQDVQRKRIAVAIIAIVIVVLLFVGIDASKKAKEVRLLHENYITLETSILEKLTLAESRINSDAEAAEIALFDGQQILDKSGLDFEMISDEDKKALEEIKTRITNLEDKLYKRVAISKGNQLELYLDARLDLGAKSLPTDIAIYKDPQQSEYLYLTDSGNNKLYYGSTNGKFTAVEDTSSVIKDPLFVDAGYEGVYIYDKQVGGIFAPYGENTGIPGAVKVITGLEPSDFQVENPTGMGVFTSADNFYLLDGENKAIMKVNNDEGKFGFPFTYLVDDSLTLSKDIMADFIIYTLGGGSAGLNAFQYNAGESRVLNSGWQITGLRKPSENLVAGYTGATLDYHIFVFDQSGKRLLVFEKPSDADGRHPGQLLLLREFVYRGDDEKILSDVKDIVVDNSQQNVYILDGTSVWKMSLNGL